MEQQENNHINEEEPQNWSDTESNYLDKDTPTTPVVSEQEKENKNSQEKLRKNWIEYSSNPTTQSMPSKQDDAEEKKALMGILKKRRAAHSNEKYRFDSLKAISDLIKNKQKEEKKINSN